MTHTPHTGKYKCTQTHAHTDTDTILHFTLFGSFGLHAKDTNFTFGTPHTHRYTQTHAHIQIPFLHFALFGSFGIHAKDIWYTTELHLHRHSDMHTHRHMQIQRH